MDPGQVFELRISIMGPLVRLVYSINIDALHTWLHGLQMDGDTRGQRNGKVI